MRGSIACFMPVLAYSTVQSVKSLTQGISPTLMCCVERAIVLIFMEVQKQFCSLYKTRKAFGLDHKNIAMYHFVSDLRTLNLSLRKVSYLRTFKHSLLCKTSPSRV